MSTALIEKLYNDNKDLSTFLINNGEISFQSQLDNNFKKVLLLAAASNLEYIITDLLIEFAKKACNDCQTLISFIQNKAIRRQYHTFFDWNNNSANPFFALFGEDFKNEIKASISSDKNLNDGVRAFMEIGSLRNTMVHEDYVSFYLDKTADEVFELYSQSQIFIKYLTDKLLNTI